MIYKIVPRDFEFEIEADSPEDAMEKFAATMETDMNIYAEAVVESKSNLEKFAYEEARSRLEDNYEDVFTEDDVERVGYALAQYFVYNECALNYDGVDYIVAHEMECK